MLCEMNNCCDGTVTLRLHANEANAEERRFLANLSKRQVEIKNVADIKMSFSPDERMEILVTFGSITV